MPLIFWIFKLIKFFLFCFLCFIFIIFYFICFLYFNLNIKDTDTKEFNLEDKLLGNEVFEYLNKIDFNELKEINLSNNSLTEIKFN